jgi:hypothetical protein
MGFVALQSLSVEPDSQQQAGRIFDRLERNFGHGTVFEDVDTRPLGEHFPDKVKAAITECGVFVDLIGEYWLDIRDADGNRRLDDAGDYFRLEIEEALRQRVKTVPVLLDGASIPTNDGLPPTLRAPATIYAPRVRPDPDFKNDASLLLRIVEDKRPGQNSPSRIEPGNRELVGRYGPDGYEVPRGHGQIA